MNGQKILIQISKAMMLQNPSHHLVVFKLPHRFLIAAGIFQDTGTYQKIRTAADIQHAPENIRIDFPFRLFGIEKPFSSRKIFRKGAIAAAVFRSLLLQ